MLTSINTGGIVEVMLITTIGGLLGVCASVLELNKIVGSGSYKGRGRTATLRFGNKNLLACVKTPVARVARYSNANVNSNSCALV